MKTLKHAYIGYYDDNGETHGFKIKTFRNVNAINSYKIDYVHHISKAFNFILGRVAYFSDRFNKPIPEIIITGKDLANNIECSVSHASSYVVPKLKEIFNIDYIREGNTHGARTIRINKRIIDFLKVYSEEEFQSYIMLHNLEEHEYILRRLYERRIWQVSDSQLTKEQQKAKQEFMDQEEIKNYHSYIYTSNRSHDKRIEYIEKSRKYLNDIEKNQLERINDERKSAKKLSWYLHQVLLKLEQKISGLLRRHDKEPKSQEPKSQKARQNLNQGANESYVAAIRAAQKTLDADPDAETEWTYQDSVQFLKIWNNISHSEHLDTIKVLTINRHNLLSSIVKSYSKKEIYKALSNIKRLYHDPKYKYKLTFQQFTSKRFLNVLESNEYDTRIKTEQQSWEDGISYILEVNRIKSLVPSFITIEEANNWFRAN